MEAFVDWLSNHVLDAILIAGTLYAIGYVVTHRRKLFYKK